MTTEEDYKNSRREINKIIETAFSQGLDRHLHILASYRAQCIHKSIKEWYKKYSKENTIPNFEEYINIPDNLSYVLGKLYTDYFKHTIIYRALNGNVNNIIFSKIISFELHFFQQNHVIEKSKENIKIKNKQKLHETLFHINPLAHFYFYRILKEIHFKKHLDILEAKELADNLNSVLLNK